MSDEKLMPDDSEIREMLMTMVNRKNILKGVLPVLVNIDKSRDKLMHVPSDNSRLSGMKGVTAVPVLMYTDSNDNNALMYITTNILEECGVSRKELFEAAYDNLDKNPVIMRDMFSIFENFNSMFGSDKNSIKPEDL